MRVEELTLQQRRKAADAEEKKLRRKGWTEAKIARWREQKSHVPAGPRKSLEPTEWVDFLKEVLTSGKTPTVGILLHWYSGSLDGRIQLNGRQIIKLSGITSDALGHIQEDVLYVFGTEA